MDKINIKNHKNPRFTVFTKCTIYSKMYHHHKISPPPRPKRERPREECVETALLCVGNQAKLTHKLSHVSVITLQDIFLAHTPI